MYFEPDGDLRYKFNSKPKLVTVPDTEIMQVNESAIWMDIRMKSVETISRFIHGTSSGKSQRFVVTLKCRYTVT